MSEDGSNAGDDNVSAKSEVLDPATMVNPEKLTQGLSRIQRTHGKYKWITLIES